jgi:hypothetical protein
MGQAKRKYKIGIILAVLGLVLLAAAGVVMILLGYTPGIYQPFERPGSGQVSPYLTHNMGPGFFTGMQGDKPFEMVFQQWGVNEMLALMAETMIFGEFTVSSPTVVMNPGSLVVMATVQVKGISSVLSITARPVMDQEGRLNLNIQSATLGAVPVLGLIRRIGQEAARGYLTGSDEQAFAGVVNSVLNNEPFDPLVSVSQYTMRLKALTLEEGKVRLLIEPVKDKDVRRVGGPKVP